MTYHSEREEKLLERIIETEGIKKIQDAIEAVCYGKTAAGVPKPILVTDDGKLVASLG